MLAKSRWSARRGFLGLVLAVPFALLAAPAASASTAVTLNPVPTPSKNTQPSFSGTATGSANVTVRVYEGDKAEGIEATTPLKAGVADDQWASTAVSPPLEDGEYTAIATQPGSPEPSNPVTFTVDTLPPNVTLNQVSALSNDTTPSFSGTASEATPVIVYIYEGTRPEGEIISTATATVGGSWTSGDATPALPNGTFTAIAIQESAIGNGPGTSAPVTFEVETKSPTVTLNAPASRSNDATPFFSGTASDTKAVTVAVYAGATAHGSSVWSASATPVGGSWTSASVSPALPSGQYTAVASQESSLENPPGTSESRTFTVDTEPPTVTLNAPSSPTDASPSFSGTASEDMPVTVDIYAGANASGPVVASATAQGTGGAWTSSAASPSLPDGQYVAVATQESSLGNGPGASPAVPFTVDPRAPIVAAEAASAVTRISAALNASVDPNAGTLSACRFEYGTTASYGASADCAFSGGGGSECAFAPGASGECAFPSGGNAVPVLARVFGLSPGTTYLFRIVAADEGGTGVATGTFTTVGARAHSSSLAGAPDSGFAIKSVHASSNGTVTVVLIPVQAGQATLAVTAPTASISRNDAVIAKKATRCKKNQIKLKGKCEPANTVSAKLSARGLAGLRLSLTAKPSSKLKAALSEGKTVHLTATLSYRSSLGGTPVVKVFHETIRSAKPAKRRGH